MYISELDNVESLLLVDYKHTIDIILKEQQKSKEFLFSALSKNP